MQLFTAQSAVELRMRRLSLLPLLHRSAGEALGSSHLVPSLSRSTAPEWRSHLPPLRSPSRPANPQISKTLQLWAGQHQRGFEHRECPLASPSVPPRIMLRCEVGPGAHLARVTPPRPPTPLPRGG
eukprot:1995666-Amphidinium_carterae.1